MKNQRTYSILLFAAALFVLSCKSHKNDPAPANANGAATNVPAGPLSLHLHSYIGETEIDGYNIVYRDDNKRRISLSRAQLYISNIELVKFDGTIYAVKDVILLTKIDNEVYAVGNVPVGNYKSINFSVGLNSAQNAQASAGSPLNDASMWFNSTSQANGYEFLSCIGKIDTTAAAANNTDPSDAGMVPFTCNIGTNAHLKKVSMPVQNYTVTVGSTTFVHITMNYAALFNGVNLLDHSNLTIATESDNALPVAAQISNNISSMFKYE